MADNTPMKSIRLKCLDCMAKSWRYVEKCHIQECSLWEYRFGHRPETSLANNKNVKRDENIKIFGEIDVKAGSQEI